VKKNGSFIRENSGSVSEFGEKSFGNLNTPCKA